MLLVSGSLFIMISRNWISRYHVTNVAYLGATIGSIIASAIWWKKKICWKQNDYFLKTGLKGSRIIYLINLEWINSGHLSKQYSIVFNPNSCGILVYKLFTSKDTCLRSFVFKSFFNFSCLFLRKSKSSFT